MYTYLFFRNTSYFHDREKNYNSPLFCLFSFQREIYLFLIVPETHLLQNLGK
jgi:hypothetical protein